MPERVGYTVKVFTIHEVLDLLDKYSTPSSHQFMPFIRADAYAELVAELRRMRKKLRKKGGEKDA